MRSEQLITTNNGLTINVAPWEPQPLTVSIDIPLHIIVKGEKVTITPEQILEALKS